MIDNIVFKDYPLNRVKLSDQKQSWARDKPLLLASTLLTNSVVLNKSKDLGIIRLFQIKFLLIICSIFFFKTNQILSLNKVISLLCWSNHLIPRAGFTDFSIICLMKINHFLVLIQNGCHSHG